MLFIIFSLGYFLIYAHGKIATPKIFPCPSNSSFIVLVFTTARILAVNEEKHAIASTRNYPLHGYVLGALTKLIGRR